eukprot:262583-Heterocapsa_arctica.AAC.1
MTNEVNTPDSTRTYTIKEYNVKYPKTVAETKTGNYKDVSELLKARPELKLKELSKQYLRDALLGMTSSSPPPLHPRVP